MEHDIEDNASGTKEKIDELANRVPRCRDFDADCADLDHLHCYLYDPAKGHCPYLRK